MKVNFALIAIEYTLVSKEQIIYIYILLLLFVCSTQSSDMDKISVISFLGLFLIIDRNNIRQNSYYIMIIVVFFVWAKWCSELLNDCFVVSHLLEEFLNFTNFTMEKGHFKSQNKKDV